MGSWSPRQSVITLRDGSGGSWRPGPGLVPGRRWQTLSRCWAEQTATNRRRPAKIDYLVSTNQSTLAWYLLQGGGS